MLLQKVMPNSRHARQLDFSRDSLPAPSLRTSRTTGPVFTVVKTDRNANFKWGVRHYVGKKYH